MACFSPWLLHKPQSAYAKIKVLINQDLIDLETKSGCQVLPIFNHDGALLLVAAATAEAQAVIPVPRVSQALRWAGQSDLSPTCSQPSGSPSGLGGSCLHVSWFHVIGRVRGLPGAQRVGPQLNLTDQTRDGRGDA